MIFEQKKTSSDETRTGIGYNEISKSSGAVPIHVDFPVIKLEDHIRFEGGSKNDNVCTITLTDVDDFGVSPMLRKMLGLHFTDKFSMEHFEFRKRARIFLNEISHADDYKLKEFKDFVSIFDIEQWEKSSVAQRNELYKQVNVDFKEWLLSRGSEIEDDLNRIISDMEHKYAQFIINRYGKKEIESKLDFTFESSVLDDYPEILEHIGPLKKKEKVFLPFSCWTKIEFLLFSIFEPIINSPQHSLVPRHKFNPNLFSVLYIYSNIVDLVAVNDGNFRLLSTIFLKGD